MRIFRVTRHDVADLLRRTSHVDVNDLCALRDVEPGGMRHHDRIGAGNLNGYGFVLTGMVNAAPRFLTPPHERI